MTNPAEGAIHKRISEYDGAFRCLDCGAQWGALPGAPAEPTVCSRAEGATPKRYMLKGGWGDSDPYIDEAEDGPYVEHEDYAALEKKLSEANAKVEEVTDDYLRRHKDVGDMLERAIASERALRNLIDEVRTTFRNGRIPEDLNYRVRLGEEVLSGAKKEDEAL